VTTGTASSQALRFRTRGNGHILDITGEVQGAVADSGIETGQAVAGD
jgi:thiamine phosphate synthase YjbQ (UPF0047 family)